MSYVPGYQHDIFLSYARGDSTWVEAFRKALAQAVRDKLGQDPKVWQDTQNIRFGQSWPDEIHSGIRDAAAFLSVCSASYFHSEWCTKEYNAFVPDGNLDALRAGSFYRFQKIVKAPDLEGLHKDFFDTLESVDFFDEKSGEEFLPGSREFDNCVRRAAKGIAQLLETIRNQKLKLYVATVAPDLENEWKQLRTDLFDHVFNVRPRERLNAAFGDNALRRELNDARLAIFMLGGEPDKFVQRQIARATELDVPIVFWIHPRKSKDAKKEQQELIDRIRSATDLPKGSQLLSSRTTQDLIYDIIELLAPQPLREPASHTGSVYLIHDPTQEHEAGRARRLRALLCEHKLAVLPEDSRSLSIDRHQYFMNSCDGMLLYRGRFPMPDRWLVEYLGDLLLADANYGPKAAKTLLLENPAQVMALPGVDVLPYVEPLTPALLQPFIARMQEARQMHVGN